jgi:hypothetical protein
MGKQEKTLCSRVKSDLKKVKKNIPKAKIDFRGFGIWLQVKKSER